MIMRWAYHSRTYSTAQPKYQGAALPYPTETGASHPPLVPLDIGSMATSAETKPGQSTLPTAKIGKGRHDPHIKKSQSMKDVFGNAFAFDRVATEPRFNAMKTSTTPSVGYYSPVYTLTLPTLTGGILSRSGITEKYVPKSLVQARNSDDIVSAGTTTKRGKQSKPKFSRSMSTLDPKKGPKFSSRLRMASHPDFAHAQLNGVDKVFVPGIHDSPGPLTYNPMHTKATFQLKAAARDKELAKAGKTRFGKKKKKKSIDYTRSTAQLAMAKLNNQTQNEMDDAERLRLAVALANNRNRSKKVGGGTRTSWSERDYDLHNDTVLHRINSHEMSINKVATAPPNTGRYVRDELEQKAIEAELEPYFVEGRKEVKSIDNYVYKFQSQRQVYKRELSKRMQQEMFMEKKNKKRRELNLILESLGEKKHDSPVLFGRERVMSVYYKSWMEMEPSEPSYEPILERYKHYQKKKIRQELMKKGKKSKNALKKLKRLDMDEESSGDEEDDVDLTITRVPKIDMNNPLRYQYERMKEREGRAVNGYLYEKPKKTFFYPTDG